MPSFTQSLRRWFAPQNMMVGSPRRRIAEFAIPMIIGNFAQQLYNTADSIIVGRYVGDNALAAVGSAFPVLNLLLSLFVGIATGAGILVAQHFGAGNRQQLSRTIGNCLILSAGASAALCLFKLLSLRQVFTLNRDALRARKSYLLSICRLGIPAGITQAIFSIAMLFVQSLTNGFGEMIIACNVVVMRVDGFIMMPNFSFGQAMSTYAGQNIGAGRRDRVLSGTRQGTVMAVMCAAVLTAVILVFGEGMIALFTDTPELISLGANMMRILAVGYLAMAVTQCLGGVIRGVGDTMTPMWISIAVTVVIRVPLAYGLAWLSRSPELPLGNPVTLYISLAISWCMGALLTMLAYRFGRWRSRMSAISVAEAAG